MYLELPPKAKPSKVLSKDKTSMYQCAYVWHDKDGWKLIATNTYAAVKLNLRPVGEFPHDSFDQGRVYVITTEAMRHVERVGGFLVNGAMQIGPVRRGKGNLPAEQIRVWYEQGSTQEDMPGKVLRVIEGEKAPPPDTFNFGVNARYLWELAQALGHDAIEMFPGNTGLRSIKIFPPDGKQSGVGVIMPIRISS